MGLLSKLLGGSEDEEVDEEPEAEVEEEPEESEESDDTGSRSVRFLTHEEIMDLDEDELPGPDSINLDTRDAPSGWKCTKNTDYWGIHYKEKGLFKAAEKVRIDLVGGAGAQCYRLEPGSDTRHIMSNGPATVPEAVAVAKLYMAYGFTPPTCAVRYEPEDGGVGFTKIDLKHYLEVIKQDDRHPLVVHSEYTSRAGDMDDQLNQYYRGEAADPYNVQRY